MILFIYGENAYRCRRILKDVIAQAAHKGLLPEYFFCRELQELAPAVWQERLRQESLWGRKKKFFIFLQPFISDTIQNAILHILSSSRLRPDDRFLFYEEGIPDARNKLFSVLKKEATCYVGSDLKGRALQEWIRKEIRRLGGAIVSAACSQLAWISGGDLWRLENEMKKLIAFAQGRAITPKDIAEICGPNLQTTVFQFVDAVAEKNSKEAITFLYRKIAEGEEPLRLLASLIAQFRKILLLKEAQGSGGVARKIQQEWKMHPYVFQKTFAQARQFSGSELKKIYRALFAADVKIKTGSQSGQAVLESFLLDLHR